MVANRQDRPKQGTVQDLINGLLDRGYTDKVQPVLDAVARSVNSGLIKQRLGELDAEVARLLEAGETLKPSNPVLRALLADLDDTMKVNGRVVDGAAEAVQQTGMDAAARIQRQLALPGMTDQQLARIGIAWNKPDPEAVARLIQYADSDAWANMLAKYGTDIVDIVKNQAVRGIAEGWSPLRIAAAVRNATENLPGYQANTLMRTLQLTSYRDATAANQNANVAIIEQVVRIAALDDRTCLSCIALHGTVVWDAERDGGTPVNRVDEHWNGRCLPPGQMVNTRDGLKPVETIQIGDYVLTHMGRYRKVTATFNRDYNGEIIQLGALQVTPEHPIMTQRGWVEARNLNASDTLLTLNGMEARVSSLKTSHPNDAKNESRLTSLARWVTETCQRGSNSTANISAEKPKSILNVPTANSGVGYRPISLSAFRNSLSRLLWFSRQRSWRNNARFFGASFKAAATTNRFSISGSFSNWRRTASLPSIGWIPDALMSLDNVRWLIPVSFTNSRYVAFSSTYRRFKNVSMDSPNLFSSSRFHSPDFLAPDSKSVSANNPIFRRLCNTASRVLPSIRSAISFAVKPCECSSINNASSSGVQCVPYNFASLKSNTIIIHHPLYLGKVYDLTVEEDHSFFASGIGVHNCTSIVQVKGRPPFNIVTGVDWFNGLSTSRQQQQASFANSPGKWEAFKTGQVTLDSFVHQQNDATFGDMVREASLSDALKGNNNNPFVSLGSPSSDVADLIPQDEIRGFGRIDQSAQALGDKWAASLNFGEKDAIEYWTQNGYSEFRALGRGQSLSSFASGTRKYNDFKSALASAPDYQGVVFRGVSLDGDPQTIFDTWQNQIGTSIQWDTYTSTSASAEVAGSFTRGRANVPLMFEVYDGNGKFINSASPRQGTRDDEFEIITLPNSTFTVLDVFNGSYESPFGIRDAIIVQLRGSNG